MTTSSTTSFFKCRLFLVATLLLSCTDHLVSGRNSNLGDSACLNVPAKKFAKTVGSTEAVLRQVLSTVSNFSSSSKAAITDFRLSNALSDCFDLLDFSLDLLNYTLSASQNPNGKYSSSTGDVIDDMKTSMCGVMVMPETCKEGFNGTSDNLVRDLIFGQLDQATSLANNLLSMINPSPTILARGRGRKLTGDDEGFPNWLKPRDRKLLLVATNATTADAVVAADGTGDYTTISEAVEAAPDHSSRRYVIYIKKGVYKEYVEINKKKWNIMIVGDGIDSTVISGNHSYTDHWTTYRSATFGVKGRGFVARDITFENTAGPGKMQAVAFRSDSDQSVLYRCAMRGYQDTLYVHAMRHFYRECIISGTVDFICGRGTAVFQNCQILARKGLPGQKNTITAQARTSINEKSAFSIQFCNISAEPEVFASLNSTQTYLGRPWRMFAATVIMQSYISNAISPDGWLKWNDSVPVDNLFYGEYMNYGPGSGVRGRVKWPGYHVISDPVIAIEFTVARLINGNSWLPPTGVRFTAGLTN